MKISFLITVYFFIFSLYYSQPVIASSNISYNSKQPYSELPSKVDRQYLDSSQKQCLKKFLGESDNAKIIWDKYTNVPRFITGKIFKGKSMDSKTTALAFFEKYQDLFKIKNYKEELSIKNISKDTLDITHLKLMQNYKGIDVYGAEVAVHINRKNEITSINGRFIPDIKIDTKPTVTKSESLKVVLKDILHNIGNIPIHIRNSNLIIYDEGIIKNEIKENKLLWKIDVESKRALEKWVYFIDAKKGEVVYKYEDVKSYKNRKIYNSDNSGLIPGELWITEKGAEEINTPDVVGWLAFINLGLIYDYFYERFGFDNWHDSIIASVHYGNYFEGSKWFDFLDNPQLICGDGDKNQKEWGPACNGLDIMGHEMTHALLQYHNVSLNCCSQQGALEESYSDLFGVLIDERNWVIGEDVYYPENPEKFYRSFSNPSLGEKIICGDNSVHVQPEHMEDYDYTPCDKYGVHINSGILNKAAYNIASVIGREKTAQLYYHSIPYLTRNTDFSQLSYIIPITCYNIFSFDSEECVAVKEGFSKVGL